MNTTETAKPLGLGSTEGVGPLAEAAGLLACIDDEYLKRGDWRPLVQAFADAVRAAERERCIAVVQKWRNAYPSEDGTRDALDELRA